MLARIEILQWREAYDDEDSLSVGVFAEGDDTDFAKEECDAHELGWIGDKEPDDVDRAFLQINDFTIFHGDILQHNGRSFQVNIVEVQRAAI